jgi:RNA polymerase sigma factor (sigma-70 family)
LGTLVDFNIELISACRNNNRKAQLELYKFFSRRMYNTSLRIVKNRVLAEDVVQEVFINAFKSLDKYKGEVPFDAWLRRIVINRSIDELRKENKYLFDSVDDWIVTEETYYENTDYEETNRLIKIIKEKLNELPHGYRVILSLFYLEGYDHEEISLILGISQSTSRSQLTRAIKKLKEDSTIKRMANEFRQI